MKKTISTIIGALLCGFAGLNGGNLLGATTIVNWDGGADGQNYIAGALIARSAGMNLLSGNGANINFAGASNITDRQALTSRLSTTPFSPSTNYPNGVNTSLYSTTFYGAAESIMVDQISGLFYAAITVRDAADGNGSYLNFTTPNTGVSNGILTSAILFKKADFLGNLGSDPLTLTSANITISTCISMRGRWLVQNGSSYYLSSTTFNSTASITDFSTSTWALYDLAGASIGGASMNLQPTVFSTVNFDNVQSVGFYIETWNGTSQILSTVNAANYGRMYITDFSVTAVIPEPSVWALLGIGAALLAGTRALRNRNNINK